MLDKIDMKLLYELTWNCRQTNTALGKKLRISKQVVNYRIQRLEKEKIITNYTAQINWRKLGYNAIRAYIKWRNLDPETESKVYEDVKKDPFFLWSAHLEGSFDVAFYMWAKEIPEFAEKWSEFLTKYRKHIQTQEIYESVNMTIYPMKPFVKDFVSDERIIGVGKKEDYDEKDYKIMLALSKNARISAVNLAKLVDLTPKSALTRLKQLEEKGILLGYFAVIDPRKLSMDFYKIDFYLNDISKMKEMREFAKQHKKVWAVMKTIGGPDFEVEILVSNTKELRQVINEIRTRFADQIEHYRFHRFENIKQVYLPGEN